MKRWNGHSHSFRPVDVSLQEEPVPTRPGYCLVCDRLLPRGKQRIYCLDHSPYPQMLIRRERRRRSRDRSTAA